MTKTKRGAKRGSNNGGGRRSLGQYVRVTVQVPQDDAERMDQARGKASRSEWVRNVIHAAIDTGAKTP